MHCNLCQYQERIDGGVKEITCRAIRQHPVFDHLGAEARKMLELDACINGLNYTTKDNEPLVTIDPHAQGMMEANWPMEFKAEHITDCKFYTLGRHAIGWEKI
jgi:hypothetical protein